MTTTEAPLLPVNSIGGYVERMWSYMTIKKLLETSKYGGVDEAKAKDLKAKALALSLKV